MSIHDNNMVDTIQDFGAKPLLGIANNNVIHMYHPYYNNLHKNIFEKTSLEPTNTPHPQRYTTLYKQTNNMW